MTLRETATTSVNKYYLVLAAASAVLASSRSVSAEEIVVDLTAVFRGLDLDSSLAPSSNTTRTKSVSEYAPTLSQYLSQPWIKQPGPLTHGF
jgi:hypothetical protein